MRHLTGAFTALAYAAVSLAQPEPSKQVAPPKTIDSASIDAYLTEKVKEQGTVGLSVVVFRDGLPVISKVYGVSSTKTNTPLRVDTAFAIGSVTKQFACACVFLLNEEGKLFFRDSVAKFYPGLNRANDINLYDLMTHTSGYRDYYPLDFIDRRMMKSIEPDILIRQYAGEKLDFEPGTRWSYSNTGYVILGRAIEKASDEQLGKFIERRILKPMRMDHSYFEPAADSPNCARGHTSVLLGAPEPIPLESPKWLNAAGGLFCTADDLARWNMALMSGRFLKPDSWTTMITPRELKNGKVQNYGCGLSVTRQEGDLVLSHSGAISGFRAYNTMIPRTKSFVIVLCNDEYSDVGAIHRDLISLILREQAKREDSVPKVAGKTPKEAAAAFFKQLQSGEIDRSQVGDEFNFYLTDARLKDGATRLRDFGDPTAVDVQGLHERGGMEACTVRFTFKTGVVKASMFRGPDGKIEQFLLAK